MLKKKTLYDFKSIQSESTNNRAGITLFSNKHDNETDDQKSVDGKRDEGLELGDVTMVPMEYRRAFVKNRERIDDIQRNIKKIFEEADKPFITKIKGKNLMSHRMSILDTNQATKNSKSPVKKFKKRKNVYERLYNLAKEEKFSS